MIPKKIEFINVFPLNVNGKIDRNKLNQLLKNKHDNLIRNATIDDIDFFNRDSNFAEKSNTTKLDFKLY
jgi:hypothetical protein